MATPTAKNKKVAQIIEGLKSSQDVLIHKALKEISKHGNETVVAPLLNLFHETDEPKIEAKIIEILSSVKDEAAQQAILSSLSEMKSGTKRAKVISSIWNAGYDGSSHVLDLTTIAINGTLEECLECITVIEESEVNFEYEDLNESIFMLQDAISEKENEKTQMLATLTGYLEGISNF